MMRQPAFFLVESGLSDRITLEMGAGERASLGIRALVLENQKQSMQVVGGLDGLISSAENHLMGIETPVGDGSRLWARSVWNTRWASLGGGLSVTLSDGSTNWTPMLSAKVHFQKYVKASAGWELAYKDEVLHQSIGFGLGWKTVQASFGFSEFQSWLSRDGAFGWFGSPPPGAVTGDDNPGVWMRATWSIVLPESDLLPFGSQAPRTHESAPSAQQLSTLDQAMTRLSVRRDLAELAFMATNEEENPTRRSLIRRQILSGGELARLELWKAVLSMDLPKTERMQAMATVSMVLQEGDTASLRELAGEPDSDLRMACVREVLRLDSPPAHKLLELLAQDPDQNIRMVAAMGLQNAQKPAPVPEKTETDKPEAQAPGDTTITKEKRE
jgi:hypothetical protein